MKHGGLFSGIGGFSKGFADAGIETIWDVEIEPYAQKVLRKNFPNTEIFTDVKEVHGQEACPMAHSEGANNPQQDREANTRGETISRRDTEIRVESGRCCPNCLPKIDILSGGFPCQDISVAGKQAGIADGTRSGLWSEFHRIIGELRPRYVVIENVANLLVLGLDRVLCDLAEIGYDVEWQIISANDVGAPHLRKRIWIVAYPQCGGLEGWEEALRQEERRDSNTGYDWENIGSTGRNGQWHIEPNVGRVANGIPFRVHRLKGLGNAIVPQIAEIIGRRLMEIG